MDTKTKAIWALGAVLTVSLYFNQVQSQPTPGCTYSEVASWDNTAKEWRCISPRDLK